jgi:hypothetical protein
MYQTSSHIAHSSSSMALDTLIPGLYCASSNSGQQVVSMTCRIEDNRQPRTSRDLRHIGEWPPGAAQAARWRHTASQKCRGSRDIPSDPLKSREETMELKGEGKGAVRRYNVPEPSMSERVIINFYRIHSHCYCPHWTSPWLGQMPGWPDWRRRRLCLTGRQLNTNSHCISISLTDSNKT